VPSVAVRSSRPASRKDGHSPDTTAVPGQLSKRALSHVLVVDSPPLSFGSSQGVQAARGLIRASTITEPVAELNRTKSKRRGKRSR
jgi:hypothetical protein